MIAYFNDNDEYLFIKTHRLMNEVGSIFCIDRRNKAHFCRWCVVSEWVIKEVQKNIVCSIYY